MKDFDYKQIDDLIHSRIRLAIISVLVTGEVADFNYIKKKVNATDGNLSVHIKKLEEAKYISVSKTFMERKPHTSYKLTKKGSQAFEAYVNKLEELIKK